MRAKESILKALRMNVPSSANENMSIRSEVLLYREKPEIKWVRLYAMTNISDKNVFQDSERSMFQICIDKLKLYTANGTFTRCRSSKT